MIPKIGIPYVVAAHTFIYLEVLTIGDIPRFSDFAGERMRLDGPKLKITEVLNKEIQITGFKIDLSKYKDAEGKPKNRLMLQFILGGEKYVLFTGSEVLIALTEEFQNQIPFYATIVAVGQSSRRYYTYS